MPMKRAIFFCWGDDEMCSELRKFIEDAGVVVDYRDIGKDPLNVRELGRLVGNLQIRHFVNTLSPAYAKLGFDKNGLDRIEVIKAMAEDHTLIRRPIVKSSRLITIGNDKRRIGEMLQFGSDNHEPMSDPPPPRRGGGSKQHRRSHAGASR